MPPARLNIVLLLAATVGIDAVVCLIASNDGRSEMIGALLFALVFSQLNLMAVWLALGSFFVWARLAVVAGGVLGWAMAFSSFVVGGAQTVEVTTMFAVQACVATVVVGPLRLAGYRVVDTTATGDQFGQAPQPQRFQFSIAQLLVWTTVVAVMSMLAKYAIFPKHDWFSLVVAEILNVVLLLATLWAIADAHHWRRNLIPLLGIAGMLGGLVWLSASSNEGPFFFITLYLLQAALLAGSLGVFRIAGYRVGHLAGPLPAIE